MIIFLIHFPSNNIYLTLFAQVLYEYVLNTVVCKVYTYTYWYLFE